jgi:hypothetical protein
MTDYHDVASAYRNALKSPARRYRDEMADLDTLIAAIVG